MTEPNGRIVSPDSAQCPSVDVAYAFVLPSYQCCLRGWNQQTTG
jgi:hypothetical protein